MKLSRQPLRLEREYHITQRLYREVSSRDLLCKPVDKLTLPNGLSAFIFEDYGKNLLDEYQNNISLKSFLKFAIQCCNCLEMIHKHQS